MKNKLLHNSNVDEYKKLISHYTKNRDINMLDKMYCEDNIFYQIINKQVKSDIIYEDAECILIQDIRPDDKTHLLFIPKINVINMAHLLIDIDKYNRVMSRLSYVLYLLSARGLSEFRLETNSIYRQIVFHMHIHIISNQDIDVTNLK